MIKTGDQVEFKQKFEVREIIEDHATIQINLNGLNKDKLILTVPCKYLEKSSGAWGNH